MKKILVVDDDIDILELTRLVLTRQGFEVKTLSRGEEVGEAIHLSEPDLILLDISLGTTDGRTICKSLKAVEATRDIPIILFSANIELQRNIGECMAQGFIAKPFELATLIETICGNVR